MNEAAALLERPATAKYGGFGGNHPPFSVAPAAPGPDDYERGRVFYGTYNGSDRQVFGINRKSVAAR